MRCFYIDKEYMYKIVKKECPHYNENKSREQYPPRSCMCSVFSSFCNLTPDKLLDERMKVISRISVQAYLEHLLTPETWNFRSSSYVMLYRGRTPRSPIKWVMQPFHQLRIKTSHFFLLHVGCFGRCSKFCIWIQYFYERIFHTFRSRNPLFSVPSPKGMWCECRCECGMRVGMSVFTMRFLKLIFDDFKVIFHSLYIHFQLLIVWIGGLVSSSLD